MELDRLVRREEKEERAGREPPRVPDRLCCCTLPRAAGTQVEDLAKIQTAILLD